MGGVSSVFPFSVGMMTGSGWESPSAVPRSTFGLFKEKKNKDKIRESDTKPTKNNLLRWKNFTSNNDTI